MHICIKGQGLPDTDIQIFRWNSKAKKWKLVKAHQDSVYENQLHFLSEKKYLYVKKQGTYTGIFLSSVNKKKSQLFLKDTMNLFSPQRIANHSLYCIAQDRYHRQWILRYVSDKKGVFSARVIPRSDSAGYHAPDDSDTLVFYHVGKHHTLKILFPDSSVHLIGKNPLRSFYKIRSSQILWADSSTTFYNYNLLTQKNSPLLKVSSIDYFLYIPPHELVYIQDKALHFYHLPQKTTNRIALPQEISTKKITRFYISPDKKYAAFVFQKTS